MKNLRNSGMITPDEYIGKYLEEATKYANESGFEVRIVDKDGLAMMLDMSVKPNRLNFIVRNNKVTDVFGG